MTNHVCCSFVRMDNALFSLLPYLGLISAMSYQAELRKSRRARRLSFGQATAIQSEAYSSLAREQSNDVEPRNREG